VSKHIWIRAVQADYYYTELRNIQGDRQNQLRLGVGIVFRGGGK
jgi:outer membrane immunogenic protein